MFSFRAVYKLRGTEVGLNFPLTPEEKAQLDAISRADFLADVKLKKEQGKWARIAGGSKFMGVEIRGRKWGARGSHRAFVKEEDAAAEYDRRIVAEEGLTAMTNAKYFAGEEERARAWQERFEALRKKWDGVEGSKRLWPKANAKL